MKTPIYFLMFLMMALASLVGSFIRPEYSTKNSLKAATAVPTRTPIKFFSEFKKASLNKVPPKDILEQISFFGGGGGVICAGPAPAKPKLASKPNDGVLMTQSTMLVCGWEKGEVLKGTIVYPNGLVFTKSVNVILNEGLYYGDLSFKPGISDPAGDYTFILEGKLGTAKEVVNFQKPVGPHLFFVDSKTIMFFGFSAQENVRLFYYEYGGGKFVGWQEYAMDGAGQLILKSAVAYDGIFWAVGRNGEAQLPNERSLYKGTVYPSSQTTIKKTACGDLSSRINSKQRGHIAFTKMGGDLRLHSEPGLSKSVTAKVPEGAEFTVMNGPKCADGLTWWKISVSNPNAEGWAAESYEREYLLEP